MLLLVFSKVFIKLLEEWTLRVFIQSIQLLVPETEEMQVVDSLLLTQGFDHGIPNVFVLKFMEVKFNDELFHGLLVIF